tara:strand:+ start:472 stop:1020 length:549 start_codon:yes stop_codon:yes gene_type:complete
MKPLIFLLFMLIFDSGVSERLVVKDTVDLIEINHKYHINHDGDIEKELIQMIFWEYRKNVLLPERKNGVLTGNWFQGSDYIVMDYVTMKNFRSGFPNRSFMIPYLHKGSWHACYYDTGDRCYRMITSNYYRTTRTLYDPELVNLEIIGHSLRNKLTKPDRNSRMKKIPKDIERLLDRVIEIK